MIKLVENISDLANTENVDYYIRIVDTKGVLNNMHLANKGRTSLGEYKLINY